MFAAASGTRRDQDNSITKATKEKQNKAIEWLEHKMKSKWFPETKIDIAKKYWNKIQIELPLPDHTKAPKTKELLGELLIGVVNKKGWTMSGNQNNMFKYNMWNFTFEGRQRRGGLIFVPPVTAWDVMEKLNDIGYNKGEGKGGWVADAGAFPK